MSDHTEINEAPHRGVRIVHLVFGVVFLGIAASWALAVNDVIRLDVNVAVVLPVVLILAGVAGLVAMIANAARNRRTTKQAPAPAAPYGD